MSRENLELTLKAYDAFNSHDWDAFVAFVDENVEVESRLVAMEGGYHGYAGLRRWWDAVLEAMPDYTVEIEELRDLGDVTLAHSRGLGHGAASATPVIDPFWHVLRWRNRKIVWWRNCTTEAEALEAVGLSEVAVSGGARFRHLRSPCPGGAACGRVAGRRYLGAASCVSGQTTVGDPRPSWLSSPPHLRSSPLRRRWARSRTKTVIEAGRFPSSLRERDARSLWKNRYPRARHARGHGVQRRADRDPRQLESDADQPRHRGLDRPAEARATVTETYDPEANDVSVRDQRSDLRLVLAGRPGTLRRGGRRWRLVQRNRPSAVHRSTLDSNVITSYSLNGQAIDLCPAALGLKTGPLEAAGLSE